MQSAIIAFEKGFRHTAFGLPVKRPVAMSRPFKHKPEPVLFEKMPIIIEVNLVSALRYLIATKLSQIVDSYTVKPIEHSKRLKVNLKIRAGHSCRIMHDVMTALDAAEFGRVKREG
ncbi:hypothetical protein ACFQ2T_09420 [Methylophilus flavus]|uniref:Uncharacterized protein n=1 Tax=Methylophilus flavus TaxID=640084 RepID=A0ABW3PE82_9PROT